MHFNVQQCELYEFGAIYKTNIIYYEFTIVIFPFLVTEKQIGSQVDVTLDFVGHMISVCPQVFVPCRHLSDESGADAGAGAGAGAGGTDAAQESADERDCYGNRCSLASTANRRPSRLCTTFLHVSLNTNVLCHMTVADFPFIIFYIYNFFLRYPVKVAMRKMSK